MYRNDHAGRTVGSLISEGMEGWRRVVIESDPISLDTELA